MKTNNSEADNPRLSLARENSPDTFLRKTLYQSPPSSARVALREEKSV